MLLLWQGTLVATWCLKSIFANKYFVRVADASCAYVKGTVAETVKPPIVVTSATDAITPVFAHPKNSDGGNVERDHPCDDNQTLNPSGPEYIPSTTDTTLYLKASRTVLLQTAVAEVYNLTDQTKRRSVRIVMDSGSQQSYLTTKVKQDL